MADELTCSNCGKEIESADNLEQHEVPEVDVDEEGGIHLYENNDLFLCKGCKKPLGVGRSRSD